MSIALRNFNEGHTPIQRIQEDSNLRMLLVICGLVAAPSLVLMFFLSGWVQYAFAAVIAINVAVPVMAYFSSLNPPSQQADEDLVYPVRSALTFEQAQLPQREQAPAEKVSDKV
jgi:O-antigen/teichoic acid export membrane protein